MNSIETELIKKLKNGDENAYGILYQQHYALLCHFATFYLHDKFTAETVVEDVIFHLWTNRDSLTIKTSLRNYLTRAVRNKCLDYLKLKQTQSEQAMSTLSDGLNYYIDSQMATDSPFGALLSKELEEEISNAINSLPKECQTVFLKSRMENKKNQEIADELGISINTVKYHLKNALKFLRERLEKYLVTLALLLLTN